MKTIKNLQLITVMLVALHVFGFNTNPNESLSAYETNSAMNDSVLLLIKTENGKTLYQETLKNSEELPSNFDWSELPDGNYRLEYEMGMEIKVVPVTIANEKVEYKPSYKLFVPVVNQKGSLVYISKMSFEKQSIDIAIYDSYNELVYSESLRNSNEKGRIFDFSEAENNRFKVVVKSNGRTYTKTILM